MRNWRCPEGGRWSGREWFCISYGREHVPKKSEAKKKFQSDIFKKRLRRGKWTCALLH